MSGRQQQDEKTEQWITNNLKGYPDIFSLFAMDIKLNNRRKKVASPATMKIYLQRVEHFYKYVESKGKSIYDVRYSDITAYKNSLEQKSAAYLNLTLAAINRFYDFLVKDDRIAKNPCADQVGREIPEKETIVYMEDHELKDVLVGIKHAVNRKTAKYKNRDLCLIQLGCYTGLRISEILNIDVEDLDLENGLIKNVYTKGHRDKSRTIVIGDQTQKAIMDWLVDREKIFGNLPGPLFVNPSGKRLSAAGVRKMLHKETAKLGKNITPHKMRTTCGMRTYDYSHDLNAVAKKLGHSKVETSKIYADLTERREQEITNGIEIRF